MRVIPTRAAGALVLAALGLAVSGCGTAGTTEPSGLPAEGGVDYQLGGASTPPDGVAVVVRDVTAQPEPGLYSVCYVNGFQTQPGELSQWRAEEPQAILEVDGEPVADPEWPDEYALDTRTDRARAAVLARRGAEIEECARKGFDAVELDNLDAHTRFSALSEEGGLALASSYIELAHEHGLAVAQKNSAELASRGPELGFDFAVVEECLATAECDVYAAAYGTQVIDVEYELSDDDFDARCAEAPNPRLTILRDLDLLPEGDPDRRYRACEG